MDYIFKLYTPPLNNLESQLFPGNDLPPFSQLSKQRA